MGHDNETISCSTDLAINTSDHVLALTCENELLELTVNGGIKLERSLGKLLPSIYKGGTWIWSTHYIAEKDGQVLVGRSYHKPQTDEALGVDIQLLQSGKDFTRVISLEGHTILAMATQIDHVLLSLEKGGQQLHPVIVTFR